MKKTCQSKSGSTSILKTSGLIKGNIDTNQKENQTLKSEENMPDQSDNDVGNKDINTIEKEIYQVEKIPIPFSKKLSEICQLAKRLRNRAVFVGRQVRFLL